MGTVLLIVTFFNSFAGLTGLIAVSLSILFSKMAGPSNVADQPGLLHFNAILLGLGMGTFYNSGYAFWLILFIAVFFSLLFSTWLAERFYRKGTPFLSIPFIISFWIIILVARDLRAIELTARSIYWLNNMYAVGDSQLLNFVLFFENLPVSPLVLTFFKSLSSLFFQENVLAGIVIFLVLLFQSRISVLLVLLGFVVSMLFNSIVNAYDSGINYYLLGANFIMVTLAIGGFFMLPSIYSFFWAILAVPLSFLMVIALGKIMALLNLPVYSLPFCLVTILMIHFFQHTKRYGRVVQTPYQFYSPEKNLYNYLNAKKRFFFERFYSLQLPFLGQWIVTQGHDGELTHKGDWSKALDFVIVDGQMKTYSKPGLDPANFYCYDKPILAPADGYVQAVINHVEDNEVGAINRKENWGNSIVIKHLEGLYTKLSHLRKHSINVKIGDYVRKGDIIAACGNSGRSPEPHLHFQVQAAPFVGSKSLSYPFSAYKLKVNSKEEVREYAIPVETNQVSNLLSNPDLTSAFNFQPGFRMEAHQPQTGAAEDWEVFTDAYNKTYFFCHQSKAVAYFTHTAHFFYFNSFFGNKNSMLYRFYLSAYKVALFTDPAYLVQDEFPLQLSRFGPGMWIQDFFAPFAIFRHLRYESKAPVIEGSVFAQTIHLRSSQYQEFLGVSTNKVENSITIADQKIIEITSAWSAQKITIVCKQKS